MLQPLIKYFMKKITILLSSLLVFVSFVSSQQIKFEKSFEKAKQLSQKLNKPLAIIIAINAPANPLPPNIKMLHIDPMKGLEDEAVAKIFNDNFVNYKLNYDLQNQDSLSSKLIREYKINRFPAYIFIDIKGGVILKDFGNSTSSEKYLSMLEKAIDASKQKSLVDYDEQYKSGKYDAAFLKEYINKRRKIDILNNADVIEKYVDFLTVADLNNYNEVLFILQAGPLYYGKAYKLANTNRAIIDSINKTESAPVRFAINNAIIANSFNDAVASKSVSKANMITSFVRGTWTNNYQEGARQSALIMVQFYQAIKDTNNYLQQASYYYDQYFMNIGLDSIKKLEEMNIEKMKAMSLNSVKQLLNTDTLRITDTTRIVKRQVRETISVSFSNSFATELNNAAYSFYLTKTKNPTYLTKAMFWSKRSIEISPIAAYYDTLAHLVYLFGFYVEAESTQEKAIELAKQEKLNTKNYEEELAKIKNKSL